MPIVAVLALLGATLGQPGGPPDQDKPAAGGQSDTESPPADEQQQADEPQQPEANSAAAGEQPAETGSDDAAAELDEAPRATSWRLSHTAWFDAVHVLTAAYYSGHFQYYRPFTIRYVNIHSREPTLEMTAVAERNLTPEEWGGVEEQVRTWMCGTDGRDFIGFGGVIVVRVTDPGGTSRTVTLTSCEGAREMAG